MSANIIHKKRIDKKKKKEIISKLNVEEQKNEVLYILFANMCIKIKH